MGWCPNLQGVKGCLRKGELKRGNEVRKDCSLSREWEEVAIMGKDQHNTGRAGVWSGEDGNGG